MSFNDIRNNALTRLSTILTGYKEIQNVFNIEDNEDRTLLKGYGVVFGAGSPAESPLRTVGFQSTLKVVLTNSASVRAADDAMTDAGGIYTDVETVIASFMNNTYLGDSTKMRGMMSASVSEPVLISGGQYVKIEISFIVNHKIDISYT